MKSYDAYLFDWDGTLGQTFNVWLPIVRQTLDQYSIKATDKEMVRTIFGRARAGLADLGVPERDFQNIFATWDKAAQAAMITVELYPNAKNTLEMLASQGKKLALITATVRPTVEKALATHRLADTFAVTVTGEEVRAHKPDPEGIRYALDKLGVQKSRAVMIGDSEKDIRAAHNADIDSVLFFPPEHSMFHNLDELQADKPTYTIHSWQELLDTLQ